MPVAQATAGSPRCVNTTGETERSVGHGLLHVRGKVKQRGPCRPKTEDDAKGGFV